MKMLNFDNIEDLVSYMFDHLDDEDAHVSVIANKEMVIGVMHELLNYENVMLTSCEIDYAADYDKEYIVSLSYNGISDKWYVSIEKGYLVEKEKYLAIGGYVLFHEDVNSKAMIDLQNNEFMPLGDYDCFAIGEGHNEDENSYSINGKSVSKEEFDNFVSKFKESDNKSDYSLTVKMNVGTDEGGKIFSDLKEDLRKEMVGMIDMLFRPVDDMMYRPYSFPRIFWER